MIRRGQVRDFLIRRFRWLAALFCRGLDEAVPKSKSVALITFPDGDDQGMAICLALQRMAWPGPVFWLVRGDIPILERWTAQRGLSSLRLEFLPLYSLEGFWAFLRARWVFYTHGAFFSYTPPCRKWVINLWHGMPVKRIWRGIPGSYVPQASLLASTSEFFSDVLMKAGGFDRSRLLLSGLPRNDFLLQARPEVACTVARLRGRARRLVLFLPTYRKSKVGLITHDGEETGNILGLSKLDAERLHGWLERNDCKLLVKPHPMSVHAGMEFPDDEQWALIDDSRLIREGLGLYELLSQADLLITDVSSIYVDFLITEKPQILYFPDIKKYRETRGLLLQPLENYAPGPIATSFQQLQVALDQWAVGADNWIEQRLRLRRLLIPPLPMPAADAILNAVGIRSQESNISLRETQRDAIVVALVWAQYGPYHFARLNATTRGQGEFRFVGVEIGSKSAAYAWERAASSVPIHTLCAGVSAEYVSPTTIYQRARELFIAQKIDVVMVPSYWPASSLAVFLAARAVGAKVVMMNDSHARTAKAKGILAWIKRSLVRGFDAAFVAGRPQMEYFSRLGLASSKIVMGYDTVDNDYFGNACAKAKSETEKQRTMLGLPGRYFLNVGRMEWKKSLEVLIDAYQQVRTRLGEECPRLVLVGSGKQEVALHKRCIQHGLTVLHLPAASPQPGLINVDVYFMGFRQIEVLPSFYAFASAFILPSREEEWGLVVNEAMACSLPVIVSKAAGCASDLVRPGENGFTFESGDVAGLAEHLEAIVRRPELVTTMGVASRRIISEWGCDRFAAGARQAVGIAMGITDNRADDVFGKIAKKGTSHE